MTPIQQMLLGVGAKKKTYMDDVFSTYIYTGTSANQTVNNGINLSGEGGMTWLKARNSAYDHWLVDTERGSSKAIRSNLNNAEITDTTYMNAFNSNGFTVGSNGSTNYSGVNFASWTFRKAPGFFDVVTYTGSGSTQQIAHNLKSVPGCYMIKNTSNGGSWMVYHRWNNNGVNAAHYRLMLDGNSSDSDDNVFGDTAPTATHFTAGGGHQETNQSGHSYVCYLFAGGESTAATARSVYFDGNDELTIPSSTDFDLGTTFTVEFWIKYDEELVNWRQPIGRDGSNYWKVTIDENGSAQWFTNVSGQSFSTANGAIKRGQWTHLAAVCNNGTAQWYANGVASGSSKTGITGNGYDGPIIIGGNGNNSSYYLTGWLSNFRIVKGTAVYTSTFNPPTEPLTNITNTKLLCLNNSSVTGSTVTPNTISATWGTPAAKTESPFDDPAGAVFGENGDELIIKTGSYMGNGSESDGVDVFVGFEPQWLLVKSLGQEHWGIVDLMRGWVAGGQGDVLFPNRTNSEDNGANSAMPTSTGFKLHTTNAEWNGNTEIYIYIAIRRKDVLVGKPPELGTDVFTMDTGNGNSDIPTYDSGFPVDFAFTRRTAATDPWYTSARLIHGKYLELQSGSAQGTSSNFIFDSNVGWAKDHSSDYQSWMWKRSSGFDVVNYIGDGETEYKVPHSLNKIPEMMWVKRLDNSADWSVYHKGMNGGTSPENYHMHINDNSAEVSLTSMWNDSAPTATHFSVGNNSNSNGNGYEFIALLFASVDGISKVGYYTGSSSEQTITTGFTPRFLMVKRANGSGDWYVIDTVMGNLGSSGNDTAIYLNKTEAKGDLGANYVNTTSTGFVMPGNVAGDFHYVTAKYIYYAHA